MDGSIASGFIDFPFYSGVFGSDPAKNDANTSQFEGLRLIDVCFRVSRQAGAGAFSTENATPVDVA
jgi:hypothetical protein